MSEPVRVLHVVGQMNRGGTETLLMTLLRITDNTKFRYDFVEQTSEPCDYDEEILALGSKIYRCPTIGIKSLHTYRQWWKVFFEQHPEYKIVHGHSRGSAPIYLDEANKAGRITVAHCHNNSFGRGFSGIARRIWQQPLKHIADYNFACSYDSGVSQFGKNGEFTVLRNGIDTPAFVWNLETRDGVREELGLGDCFAIGNVARFESQKNHSFLIEVFYELQKMQPDSKLVLVGRGTLENEIRQQIDSLGIADKVIFTGVRSDVNELMQAMDVFVLPSYFEGLGIVNIEAQAAGLPCFASADVVPPEAKVTELLHYIPLDKGAKFWAEEILNNRIPVTMRRNTMDDIVRAGFDIRSTAAELERFYLEALLKKSEQDHDNDPHTDL